MNSITFVMSLLGALGSIGGIVGGLATWVALPPDKRIELKNHIAAFWAHSFKALVVIGALLTAGANVREIYLFTVAETAPSRGEIVFLIITCWNALIYFASGVALFTLWRKEVHPRDFPMDSQT
ncbi:MULTISPECIES: hypothetical protein [unclassified Pseudomonas]|jgi:hypothetical protein|uniref:hypothetical protein n=1 Tax=unclassified Pseudomonas TaxID=196821 RepID=UPI001AE71644|nr:MULTISPECIES: hypothetical protein [unclassified Pseudomonas]MBP2270455.1 hypothetical protein [Pseudomonas sp. BP6]MBP2285262.1 hypothetical protein [Pseudomonas sp. BP7]HDS1697309.1 hypothetical protein [Pseudomonas putida]HDS1702467.1 hypothetical protein [Pseudomonas putida]